MTERFIVEWVPEIGKWVIRDMEKRRIIRRYVERNLKLAHARALDLNISARMGKK